MDSDTRILGKRITTTAATTAPFLIVTVYGYLKNSNGCQK
jgi:hypothetical protein